jgi:hypothetical protein
MHESTQHEAIPNTLITITGPAAEKYPVACVCHTYDDGVVLSTTKHCLGMLVQVSSID